MKKILSVLLLSLVAIAPMTSFAQAVVTFPNGAVYAVVPYNNNPFLFCTLGMPQDGWNAVNPATGTWTANRPYPNLYWVSTYMQICPKAFAAGPR